MRIIRKCLVRLCKKIVVILAGVFVTLIEHLHFVPYASTVIVLGEVKLHMSYASRAVKNMAKESHLESSTGSIVDI